jgi:hypothetical protein
MKARLPRWMRLCERVYAMLLLAYPRTFRERYGREMRQTFHDRCREFARGSQRSAPRFLAGILRDMGASVAVEHLASPAEEHAVRRIVLVLLLAAAATTFQFRDRVEQTAFVYADAIKAQRAERAALELARYRKAVADHAAQQDEAMAQAVAATLYSRADFFAGLHSSSRTNFESAKLRRDAETAAARAAELGRDNPAVLWHALYPCSQAGQRCDRAGMFVRLTQIAPDNAAVWHLAFNRALQAGDDVAARSALARMARATRYDYYEGAFARALVAAYAEVPVTAPIVNAAHDMDLSPPSPHSETVMNLLGVPSGIVMRSLLSWCADHSGADRQVRNDCRAVADRLAASESLWPRGEGIHLQYMLAQDERERVAAQARWSEFQWQREQTNKLTHGESATAVDVYDAMLAKGKSVYGARVATLQAQNIPLTPPQNWIPQDRL